VLPPAKLATEALLTAKLPRSLLRALVNNQFRRLQSCRLVFTILLCMLVLPPAELDTKAILSAMSLLRAFVQFLCRRLLILCKLVPRPAQLVTKAPLAAKLPPSLLRAFVHCQCRGLLWCKLLLPLVSVATRAHLTAKLLWSLMRAFVNIQYRQI
jgi:hypothetical protein